MNKLSKIGQKREEVSQTRPLKNLKNHTISEILTRERTKAEGAFKEERRRINNHKIDI
jgi:hypothetical protein